MKLLPLLISLLIILLLSGCKHEMTADEKIDLEKKQCIERGGVPEETISLLYHDIRCRFPDNQKMQIYP